MRDDVLVVVHCWSGDRPMVERMLPLWRQHGRVLLASPQDAPLTLFAPIGKSDGGGERGVFSRNAGGNGWIGTHVPHRLLAHWRIALEYEADWFFLNEWDSFCTREELPAYLFEDEDKFWSIEVDETWVEGPVTSGLRFSFPYFMHRKVLRRLVEKAEEIIDDVSAGPDLPLYGNKSPDGFTRHLIDQTGIAHDRFTDCLDVREFPFDRETPVILHWHGLKDASLALVSAGFVEVRDE